MSLFVATKTFATHIGCVTIYDKSLCETESTYQFKSDDLNWEMSKDEFKVKILEFLKHKSPDASFRVGSVFLWVNDFNSNSSMRIQVWDEVQSFILDVPTNIMSVDKNSDLSLRAAGVLPYPLDFGYTLGEILILCQNDCTQEHHDWLADCGATEMKSILPNVLLLAVPFNSEKKTVETIKAKANYSQLFRSAELSPVLEGNGFREMAFIVYF